MLKLYGGDLSSCSNKVRFAANAMGLEYTYIKISFKNKEHKTNDFLKMHPAGKIPVIDDEGFIVFESNAIIKYLAQKHGSVLYPQGLKERALIDQWIDFCSCHVGGAADKVIFNKLFAVRIPVAVDHRAKTEGQMFLNRFLPVIDDQLNQHLFLVDNVMSLADINLLAILDPFERAEIRLDRYPHLVAWRNNLRQQRFYTDCHCEYGLDLQEATPASL